MEGDPEDSNIEIRGIPQELDENLFLMLLENSLNGYEQIAIREFNSSSRTATISIKSPHSRDISVIHKCFFNSMLTLNLQQLLRKF